MSKESYARQKLLKEQFSASQETIPGVDYVYSGKANVQSLTGFVFCEVDLREAKNRDIVIGFETFMPNHTLDSFMEHTAKHHEPFSSRIFISAEEQLMLIKAKKKQNI